jgi:hypothetical protein
MFIKDQIYKQVSQNKLHFFVLSLVAQSIQGPGYGLDDWVSIHGRDNYSAFPFRHRIQTGSRAHLASYTMDTGDIYPGGKAAKA